MFLVATLVGCTPSTLLLVKTGAAISSMKPGDDVLQNNMGSIMVLLGIAAAVFAIPFVVKRCLALSDADLAELKGSGGGRLPREDPESQ